MTSESLEHEQLFSLSQAAKLASKMVPKRRGARALAASTLHRWARTGIAGAKLEVACVGSATCTSEAALRRFFVAVAAAKYGDGKPVAVSGKQKGQRIAAAKRELAAAGLKC